MTEARVPLKRLEELHASGLEGQAMQDALYQEYFGHPAPNHSPSARRQAAWEVFLALSDDMTEEERSEDFMGRTAFEGLHLGEPEAFPAAHQPNSKDSAA